jgi:pyruvate dehydrogenase E1 component
MAYFLPTLRAYDPAFGYELATIVKDGIRRMYVEQENLLYYITVMNEFYSQPEMPEGVEEGILKGLYKLRTSKMKKADARGKAHLFGSGTILNEAIKAQAILENDFGVSADVWSATGYKQLYTDAIEAERWNRLHPDMDTRVPYVREVLSKEKGVFVAASDYLKAVPETIAKWIPGRFVTLGTDGYGRSDSRQGLRDFFEVDARYIALAALQGLVDEGTIKDTVARNAIKKLNVNPEKVNPLTS